MGHLPAIALFVDQLRLRHSNATFKPGRFPVAFALPLAHHRIVWIMLFCFGTRVVPRLESMQLASPGPDSCDRLLPLHHISSGRRIGKALQIQERVTLIWRALAAYFAYERTGRHRVQGGQQIRV